MFSTALSASNTLPSYHTEMGYWPHKGSFFFFLEGKITLMHDSTADMTDTCDDDVDRCYTSALVDPCARDTPLFGNSNGVGLAIIRKTVSTNTNAANHAIAFEVVFDSIFVVFDLQSNILCRIGGETYDALTVVNKFFDLTWTGTEVTFVDAKSFSSGEIQTICSMDFYGLFLGVKS